jgi:branched-chain amino acid transport system substrate-binding protein
VKTPGALLLLVLAAAVLGCHGNGDGTVVIGTVYNTTGSQAVLDVPSSHGSALATKQINDEGGVLHKKLSLVAVEGTSDAKALGPKVDSLLKTNQDVVALLGLSDTDMVLNTAPAAAAHGRVFLTSGATSPKLPGQVQQYLFLACFGDNVQAAGGAQWAHDVIGARRVAVLYDSSKSYPILLHNYFVDAFESLGGTVSIDEMIDPQARQISIPAISDSDLLFLSVETAEDAARVIPLIRAAGYTGPILGGDGYDAGSVWSTVPDIKDVYFTTHVYLGADNPNPRVKSFLEAYAAAYPGEEASAFAALGYDAVGLLAAAITKEGEATPRAVLDGLGRIDGYQGVTGTISFVGGNRIPTKSVTILRVVAGKQTFVTSVTPSKVPAP